jgi:integrase/recombinase XerD
MLVLLTYLRKVRMTVALILPTQNRPLTTTPAPIAPFDAQILAGQLAPSSIAMYRRDFAAYLAFAETPAAALDAQTLARWRTHLAQQTTLSPNTINRMLSAVKRLMVAAAEQGYLSHELAAAFAHIDGVKVKALKNRTKQHARIKITPAQMRRLVDAPDRTTLIGARDAALLATLASSGLRISEATTLTVGQILEQGKGFLVSVQGKNDVAFREAPLSREAKQRIDEWLHMRPIFSQYVFTGFGGRGERSVATPISCAGAWKVVRHYAGQLGLDHIKPHDFRRFVGTQLAKKDIRVAQKALGHKRIDTTAKHYVLDELESGLTDNLF